MYKDLISYKLADGVTEERLLSVAKKVVDERMCKQPGFLKWEIHKKDDGSYTDIVYWSSKEDAQKAESEMQHVPNAGEWFGCYEEGSISTVHLEEVGSFGK